MININRSKEFSANSITNNNTNNNSHIAVNSSIAKQNQTQNYTNNINNNSHLSKGNVIFQNNSKNKSDFNQNPNNTNNNSNLNNNSKINLKASLNFSSNNNEYFNPCSSYINPNPNRFVSSNKNSMNFIAPAHLKNMNSRNDSSNIDKVNKINEFKFSSNYISNPKSPVIEDMSKKSKSIRIKLKDKDTHEDFLNDSYQKQAKRNSNNRDFSKDKSKENDTLIKNFSKDHFKDLKSKLDLEYFLLYITINNDFINHFYSKIK